MPAATGTGMPRAAIACAASIRSRRRQCLAPRHRHAAKLGLEVFGAIDV